MTPHRRLSVLLLLMLSAAVTADDPPLARSGLTRDPEPLRKDTTASPPPPSEPARAVWPQTVLQQVARGVFPASLWAALPAWPPAPQVATHHAQDNYTHMEAAVKKQLWPVFSFYLPDTTNVSWACKTDLETFYYEVFRGTDWAVDMVDSWGKFPDGLRGGNTWVAGLLDECLAITADQELPQAHFKGQYCAMSYKAIESEAQQTTTMKPTMEPTVKPSVRMAGVAGYMGVVLPMSLYGTCIPSTCTREEYEHSLTEHLERHGLELETLVCQTEDMPTLQYTTPDVIMIVTLSLMGLLVLLGTGADVWVVYTGKTHQDVDRRLRYVLVFSFHTNIKKIFHINVKENEDVISCLHGIRVLTMGWVVLGHNYLVSIYPSANKVSMINSISNNPSQYQIIINGLPSVDTFFVMSGLLVAYNLTREFNKTSKFNIPVFYIHRFIRLAPAILLLSGICAVFPPLFIRGTLSPLMTEPGNIVDMCRRYWWRDGFFLTNWFFNEFNTESCIPVCWYTAVDFQLYIVTPLMFLPLLYRRKPGAAWLAILVVASAVIPAIVIGVNELPPTQIFSSQPDVMFFYTKWVYTKPWCRASPYLVGLCLGYLLRVVDREKVKLTWWQVALGWVAALATMSAVVFGVTDYNTFSGIHEYNPAISILYGGLHRLAWGVAVAWLVFACHMGYGGLANSFLAHPFWQPLSRLTYTIFLIAFNTQFFVVFFMARVPIYYGNFNMVMVTIGILVLSAIGAVLLSLLTESPVLGLEKLILKKGN